jgi:hypothetical protein
LSSLLLPSLIKAGKGKKNYHRRENIFRPLPFPILVICSNWQIRKKSKEQPESCSQFIEYARKLSIDNLPNRQAR